MGTRGRDRTAAGGGWPVVAVLALLGFVVVLSGLTGPVHRSMSPATPDAPHATATPRFVPGPVTTPPPRSVPRQQGDGSPLWSRLALVTGVLVVLALTALVVLVVLRLRSVAREETAALSLPGPPQGATPAPPADVVAAADEGIAALSAGTDTGDAVIACWVRLERAAEASGHPRRPAATPTEFTAELLATGLGQDAAVRELLGLYHRARFGFRPLPPDAAARAIACLEAIRASARTRAAAR